MNPKITILLAAYQGQQYIAEQLNSICSQTYTNWQLFIRDDGSKDETIEIIKQFQQKDDRIYLITDGFGNLGSVQNFNTLFQHAKKAGYIMFSDQDDVWLPTKIADTISEMLKQEQQDLNKPLLVHTNFVYVDLLLEPINKKKDFEATKIKFPNLANVLCQNSVYGCTMMINQKLIDLIKNIPLVAENHDYWFALVASAFGKIIYMPKKTILYRQHGNNLSTQYDFNSFSKRVKRNLIDKKNFDDVHSKINMALAFKENYYNLLSSHNKKIVDDFIQLSHKKSPMLLVHNFKNGVRRQTLMQTLLFYVTILVQKRTSL